MAMSRRTGGSSRGRGSTLQRSVQHVGRPVYETFQPRSERKEEDGVLLLLVYLPGFVQHQITYSKDESTRFIRISGERALENNRRLRFSTSHSIPETCNLQEIKSQFLRGILTIRIPKIITPPISPKEEVTGAIFTRSPQETNGQLFPSPREISNVEKEQKQEETKEGTICQEGKDVHTPGEEGSSIGTQEDSSSRPQNTNGRQLSKPQDGVQEEQKQEGDEPREGTGGALSPVKPKEATISQKDQDEDTPTATKSVDHTISGAVVDEEAAAQKKETNGKSIKAGDHQLPKVGEEEIIKSHPKNSDSQIEEKDKSQPTVASTSDFVKEDVDVEPVSRETRLMINAGVAVVVIMALGAHMFSYICGSSRKV